MGRFEKGLHVLNLPSETDDVVCSTDYKVVFDSRTEQMPRLGHLWQFVRQAVSNRDKRSVMLRVPCDLQLGDNIFAKTRTARILRQQQDNIVTVLVKSGSQYNSNALFEQTSFGDQLVKGFKYCKTQ